MNIFSFFSGAGFLDLGFERNIQIGNYIKASDNTAMQYLIGC